MKEVNFTAAELEDAIAIHSVMYQNRILMIIKLLDRMCERGYSLHQDSYNFNISL